MSQYFDKNFFKFALGFFAIVGLACVSIIATRVYESSQLAQTTSGSVSVRK